MLHVQAFLQCKHSSFVDNLFMMTPTWPARPYVVVSSIIAVWSIFLASVFFYLRLMPWQVAADAAQAAQDEEDEKEAYIVQPAQPAPLTVSQDAARKVSMHSSHSEDSNVASKEVGSQKEVEEAAGE